MNTKWTEGQLRAICEAGGNVLVSAAAGAGKTAVLIERILRIIKEKTDIDRLLIVTFTSAAAAELRERLYLSLQKELESGALTATQAKRLCRQQTLLSKAYITTIHAFCQNVIKSNSVESGIDASFRIADTGEIAMNYQEAMEYMEKVGTYGIVPGLDSIRELCRRLGDPQNDLKFVHIAGTNGKGSTLAYISNILQAAGYRVGKYISPVIIEYCEKIQIGKQKITHKDLCEGLEIIKKHCDAMVSDGFHHPTPFEI